MHINFLGFEVINFHDFQTMSAHERAPFEKLAKNAKCGPAKEVEKYSSQGIPLSLIKKEAQHKNNDEMTMKKTIKDIVSNSFLNNSKCTRWIR